LVNFFRHFVYSASEQAVFWGFGALLLSVVELRPKGLVVASQLAAVLGPPACGRRYVSQLAVRSALRRLSRLGLA